MKISLIMCISKILTDLCVIKQKIKIKKYFCKCCLHCFSSEVVLIKHKENCLIINSKQSVKLKSDSVSFKNYFKQLPVPFKIYADFEYILKRVRVVIKIMTHTQKNIKITFLAVFIRKLCVDNKFSKQFVLYRGKNTVYKFIKAILEEYDYCKKLMKKHFNKSYYLRRRRRKISIK